MKTPKSKGLNENHLSKYREEIENLKQEVEAMEQLYEFQGKMFRISQGKRVNQSFEIIDLKEEISNHRLDKVLLIIAVIFISLVAIIK